LSHLPSGNPESDNLATSEVENLVHSSRRRTTTILGTTAVKLLEWKKHVTERKSTYKDRQTRLEELKKLPTEDKIAEIWGRLGDEDVDDDLLCEALLILEEYQPE